MRIAMVGTRGVPARYGGFETAVEEIGRRLAERGHDVVVYCRGADQKTSTHLGMRLIHLPAMKKKTAETLSHTALSAWHMLRNPVDVAIVFNAANAPVLPAIRCPTALHVDGLEWRRAKWGRNGRRYYLFCERLGVRLADELIADARGIQDYYRDTYASDSRFIPYGAPVLSEPDAERLPELGLDPGAFHLLVARFEPENNVDLIIRGFLRSTSELPLVVVGSAPYAAEYVAKVEQLADDPRVQLLGGVWDQQVLDQLYRHCASYLHGQSVGGTNPSLLRAMGAGAPVIAVDVVFTREVLGDAGVFFDDEESVARHLEAVEQDGAAARGRGLDGQRRAETTYRWDDVANAYEQLCEDLRAGRKKPTTR